MSEPLDEARKALADLRSALSVIPITSPAYAPGTEPTASDALAQVHQMIERGLNQIEVFLGRIARMSEFPENLSEVPPKIELGGAIGRQASGACKQGQHDRCAYQAYKWDMITLLNMGGSCHCRCHELKTW